MKHYGDIKKMDGSAIPIVDIICGGSPCQDLSVAGKRAGLAGARSGLFMEQIRIIKEMRDECIKQLSMRGANVFGRNVRPRFMVWENVIGAFSSNKGEDFRAVLEETARVKDENAVIPRPAKGKWSTAGAIMGNGWSIAWRVHDAQFWGVPQRRKRIALVADFGGYAAPEVLFERKGMYGNTEPSETQGEEAARAFGTDVEKAGRIGVDVYNQEITGDTAATLTGAVGGTNTSGCKVIDRQTDRQTDRYTLDNAYCVGNGQIRNITIKPIANSLDTMHDQQAVMVYGIDRAAFNQGVNAKYNFSIENDIAQTIISKGPGAVAARINDG